MGVTGADAFDKSLNKTNEWLQDRMAELNFSQQKQAYQTLRDRLVVDEAVQLGSQLPMLVRGFYYEGWKPSRTADRSKPTFFENVRQAMASAPRGKNPKISPVLYLNCFTIVSEKVKSKTSSRFFHPGWKNSGRAR